MVRPENGLFFANAAGIREAIVAEMSSSAEPVKAVLLDLGASTDLDVPSADMLADFCKELHGRKVRFMLTRVIAPVRQMLELAGAMDEIKPEDIFIGPEEAALDYLASQYDDSYFQELLHGGLLEIRSLLQTHLTTAPGEHLDTFAAIAESVDREIKRIET